ncbi:hypothetical protein P171DRAFT_435873 [Karstenula rhodostoma CBS 690.94]|uniref:Uncharacterized protein n=1 Tax=Karstenula rhodostoma CBS 690.94 TaxID=1392251 RepID=A0A9P4PBH1_9PLEO|nr:hypothetical protein P171DRAFT_435873 [Karstenula rhodostoma CBS 690.94]
MCRRTHLLRIPVEIRLQIYSYYVSSPGGYRYNHTSNTLSKLNGDPIDLGLLFTCKLIAEEIQGMALNHNTVTFSTLYSDELRQCAGQLHVTVECVRRVKIEFMLQMAGRLSTVMKQDLAHGFPDITPTLDELNRLSKDDLDQLKFKLLYSGYTFGANPSKFNDFITRLYDLITADPDFLDHAHAENCKDRFRKLPLEDQTSKRYALCLAKLLPLGFKDISQIRGPLWGIPTEGEVVQMAKDLDIIPSDVLHQGERNMDKFRIRGKLGTYPCRCYSVQDLWSRWRFSAAATAIRFLGSLALPTRKHLRQIILLEDHESIAKPESHARGLIPFCQENPRLRVDRRVNLWKSILPTTVFFGCRAPFRRPLTASEGIQSKNITRAIAPWVAEAWALESHGMPPGSFHLAIDGGAAKERAKEVFSIVIRDASYQLALEQLHRQGSIPDPISCLENTSGFQLFKDFPQAIEALVRGKNPNLSCSFDLVDFVDPSAILRQGQNWTAEQWGDNWSTHTPETFETAPELPVWKKILEKEHPVGDVLHMDADFDVATGRMRDSERNFLEVGEMMRRLYEQSRQRQS